MDRSLAVENVSVCAIGRQRINVSAAHIPIGMTQEVGCTRMYQWYWDQRVTGCRRDNGQPKRYKYRPRASTRPSISSARTHTGRVCAEYSIEFEFEFFFHCSCKLKFACIFILMNIGLSGITVTGFIAVLNREFRFEQADRADTKCPHPKNNITIKNLPTLTAPACGHLKRECIVPVLHCCNDIWWMSFAALVSQSFSER